MWGSGFDLPTQVIFGTWRAAGCLPYIEKCFVSLEDEIVAENDSLLAISPKVAMLKATHPYDRVVSESICKRVKACQSKRESKDAEARKTEEEFGKIITEQKNIFYRQRDEVLKSKNISEVLSGIIDGYTTYLSSKINIYGYVSSLDETVIICVSTYVDSSGNNLKDLPPQSLHKEGSTISSPYFCSTLCNLIQ